MYRIASSGPVTGNSCRLVCFLTLGMLVFIFSSCSPKKNTFSILEFSGADKVMNYSKSSFLWQNVSENKSPVPIAASPGDLIVFDNHLLVYDSDSSGNRFLAESNDSIMYLNGKIFSISISENEGMLGWFRNIDALDLSSLQFLGCDSVSSAEFFPYLKNLARIRPDIGISFTGDFSEMAGLLSVFKPGFIVQPTICKSDFEQLGKLNNLRILLVTFGDDIIDEPLPALPALEQIFIMEDGYELTNDLFKNNTQIRKVIINDRHVFDFSILNPLTDLRELVISGADSLINTDLINSHKKLELLSVTGETSDFDPALINLPSLRWMTFFSNVTQNEFDSFIRMHPDLEILGLVNNDTIKNLQPLTEIKNLAGLIVSDTVTDIATIKELKNLKYLSLPSEYLKKDGNEAVIRQSLPDVKLAANEGFCLGSGWLILIIPLVMMIRIMLKHSEKDIKGEIRR
jgi:hypothetical protein